MRDYLDVSSPDGEVNEIVSKPQSKPRQVPPPPTNDPSPPPPAPSVSNSDKSTGGAIRRPTIIPAPAKNGNPSKTSVIPPSIPARTQPSSSMTSSTSSVSELSSSPVPTVAKRNVIPTRSVSNASPSPITSNPRSSPSHSQTSSIPTNSSTSTGNNLTRGGIPRLTKTSQQIVKPTSAATGPTKRPGQVNQRSMSFFPSHLSLLEKKKC